MLFDQKFVVLNLWQLVVGQQFFLSNRGVENPFGVGLSSVVAVLGVGCSLAGGAQLHTSQASWGKADLDSDHCTLINNIDASLPSQHVPIRKVPDRQRQVRPQYEKAKGCH